jgi:flagellar biosynthetic protein FliQ
MTPELATHAVSQALMVAFWLCAPLLVIGLLVGLGINLLQVVTSLQDNALSTIPRLVAFFLGFLALLPYMIGKLTTYSAGIFGNLGQYAR